MLAVAHNLLGAARFSAGQLPAARKHLERAVELFGAGPSRITIAPISLRIPRTSLSLLCLSSVMHQRHLAKQTSY